MKALLGFFLLYLLINLGVIAAGLGIGFLLRRLMPSVDPGTSILIGVVATGFSIHYFVRLLTYPRVLKFTEEEEEDEAPPPIVFYPPARPGRGGRGGANNSPGSSASHRSPGGIDSGILWAGGASAMPLRFHRQSGS